LGNTKGHSWLDAEYSRSLDAVSIKKTRLEREFDLEAVRKLKAQLSCNISVGGPNLATQAIRTGLVDEYHLFIVPMMIGSGIPVMPSNVNTKIELLDERRFGKGWVYLRYRIRA
jgi:riboflavin biosynthesis pyrimidine reductase